MWLKKVKDKKKLIGVYKKGAAKMKSMLNIFSQGGLPIVSFPLFSPSNLFISSFQSLVHEQSAFFLLLISISEPSKSPNTNIHSSKKRRKIMTKNT